MAHRKVKQKKITPKNKIEETKNAMLKKNNK